MKALVLAGGSGTRLRPFSPELGLRPGESLEETVRNADCIAVLAPHRQFEDVDFGIGR